MRNAQAPQNPADTLRDVLEGYRTYLGSNRDLANHCSQFLERERNYPVAAQAEAAVFSWLRAEKLEPVIYENPSTGGPDFKATHAKANQFLVEATSIDSDVVAERSGLPAVITRAGHGAYAYITEKLKKKAQDKATQLSGQDLPTVLAITSNHAFATILMDGSAAERLMTSEPQINFPIGGGEGYMSTDLRHSVFLRQSSLLDPAGAPIIKPALRSIGAILLIALGHEGLQVAGLLNPDATNTFEPRWLANVPFVKFASVFPHQNVAIEWVQADGRQRAASFQHRANGEGIE